VQFTDWGAAEHVGSAALMPRLAQLQDLGMLAAWWFIRKAPCWRLRLQPGPAAALTDMKAAVESVLDEVMAAGLIERWWESIYEPESAAFGGAEGMDIAHALFHADSRCILGYVHRQDPVLP
jgi:thiopeptide-type bacteriocin biosynthesis protein